MKKLIALLAIAFISETMIGQTAKAATTTFPLTYGASDRGQAVVTPPAAVATAFATRFPEARISKWMERQQGYIAVFRQNHKKLYAYYSADGSWKATETPVKWSWNLPAAVKTGWHNSDYAAWYILHISKIETADSTMYTLDVNNSPLLDADHVYSFLDECVLFFSDKGQLIKKEAK